MYSLSCDKEHILHDKREPDITEIRQATIKKSDLEYWEELPLSSLSPYTKAEYDAKVAELVRRRYSADEEFAIQRKAINAAFSPSTVSDTSTALTEYQAYNTYVDDCKQQAKDPSLYTNNEDTQR
ncbi:MAG: hypothetical protein HDR82_09775 [Bacteroides sp.]|nr:hypothetical protein [Bacteroides sp.]